MKNASLIGCAILVGLFSGCATQPQIKNIDIQSVALGDTMDVVTQKIGKPDQVVSKEVTGDGRHLEKWLYEIVSRGTLRLLPAPGESLDLEKEYQVKRLSNPPSIITFVDGKVAKVERQQ